MKSSALSLLLIGAILATGCEKKENAIDDAAARAAREQATKAIAPFVLPSEPAGAIEVAAACAAAKSGESVVVHGRIGEWVDSRAQFTLVDAALPACGEKQGSTDGCQTPWDFCCEDPAEMAKKSASVELRKDGAPLAFGIKGSHGLEPLKHVVVRGKTEVDAHGNVTIAADGIFVRS